MNGAGPRRRYRAVVIGGSAGGLEALRTILRALRPDLPLATAVVLHTPARPAGMLTGVLRSGSPLPVEEAEPLAPLCGGHVYVAPGGYHLLIERDASFSLSVDPPVQYARPSVDVLFTSAADAFGPALAGVVLSGGNEDGARGLAAIRRRGGLALVQDPATADAPYMPLAALEQAGADHTAAPAGIAMLLNNLEAA